MLFDNTMKWVDSFVPMDTEVVEGSKSQAEGSKKRTREELEFDNSNKQKIDENVEVEVDDEAEMKKLIVIVPDDEMGYFQIIRADGSSRRYSSMIRMLQNIDREHLETLWKLVKAKNGNTRREEQAYERVLWGDLKVMFELDVESEVWRNHKDYNCVVWKLFSSSGVHFVRFQNLHIFMLLNRLSKDFGKRFVPQRDMSDEQALHPITDQSASSPVKIEAPQELPKDADSASYSACMYVKLIQELLGVCLEDTCLVFTRPSEKLVVVTPINKRKKVQFADTVTSSDNTPKAFNRPLLSFKELTNLVHKFLSTVKFGSDQVAKIMRYGDYQIGNVTISRVYYVEGLRHNLFIGGQPLINCCGLYLEVASENTLCFVRNSGEGVDLLSGF
ncbi:hypothetical protein Tco_1562682 [Tanacetum coccineum]